MIRGLALGAVFVAVATAAIAQTPAVDAARAAGVVGERYDGFVGVASPPSSAVRSQVATINIQRRTLYSNLATSRGVSPGEVGITAGCQLLARVRVGEAYMLADRVWRRRAPGQAAPIPDYCRA
ncbi:YdbL family protein [Sphingomonas lutea]|uniref:YdbL family protein n=1 Tax=Sphingomonas lutea TaxID=1045317 RepID=UPI001F2DCAA3|nr:YdbL family protein [Sphingomonas lutea]